MALASESNLPERVPVSVSIFEPFTLGDNDLKWYAIASNGTSRVRVTQWPLQNQHFRADDSTVIHVALFMAENDLVFLKGQGQRFAEIYIPITRVRDGGGNLFRCWFGLQPGKFLEQVTTEAVNEFYQQSVQLATDLHSPKICCTVSDSAFSERGGAGAASAERWEAALKRSVTQHSNIIASMHRQLQKQKLQSGEEIAVNNDAGNRGGNEDSSLQAEVTNLTESLTRLTQEYEVCENEKESLQSRVDTLQTFLDQHGIPVPNNWEDFKPVNSDRAQMKRLEAELAAFQGQKSKTGDRHFVLQLQAIHSSQSQLLKDQLQGQRNAVDELQKENDKLAQNSMRFEAEAGALRAELQEKTKKLVAVWAADKEKKLAMALKCQDIGATDDTDSTDGKSKGLEALREEVAVATKREEAMAKELLEERRRFEGFETNAAKMKEDMLQTQRAYQELQQCFDQQCQELMKAQNAFLRAGEEEAECRKHMRMAEADTEEELALQNSRIEDLRQLLQEKEVKLRLVEEAMQKSKKDTEDKEKRQNETKDRLLVQVKGLEDMTEALERKSERQMQEIQRLRDEAKLRQGSESEGSLQKDALLQAKGKEIQRLKEDLEAQKVKMSSIMKDVEEREQRENALRETLRETEEANDALVRQSKGQFSDLTALQEQMRAELRIVRAEKEKLMADYEQEIEERVKNQLDEVRATALAEATREALESVRREPKEETKALQSQLEITQKQGKKIRDLEADRKVLQEEITALQAKAEKGPKLAEAKEAALRSQLRSLEDANISLLQSNEELLQRQQGLTGLEEEVKLLREQRKSWLNQEDSPDVIDVRQLMEKNSQLRSELVEGQSKSLESQDELVEKNQRYLALLEDKEINLTMEREQRAQESLQFEEHQQKLIQKAAALEQCVEKWSLISGAVPEAEDLKSVSADLLSTLRIEGRIMQGDVAAVRQQPSDQHKSLQQSFEANNEKENLKEKVRVLEAELQNRREFAELDKKMRTQLQEQLRKMQDVYTASMSARKDEVKTDATKDPNESQKRAELRRIEGEKAGLVIENQRLQEQLFAVLQEQAQAAQASQRGEPAQAGAVASTGLDRQLAFYAKQNQRLRVEVNRLNALVKSRGYRDGTGEDHALTSVQSTGSLHDTDRSGSISDPQRARRIAGTPSEEQRAMDGVQRALDRISSDRSRSPEVAGESAGISSADSPVKNVTQPPEASRLPQVGAQRSFSGPAQTSPTPLVSTSQASLQAHSFSPQLLQQQQQPQLLQPQQQQQPPPQPQLLQQPQQQPQQRPAAGAVLGQTGQVPDPRRMPAGRGTPQVQYGYSVAMPSAGAQGLY